MKISYERYLSWLNSSRKRALAVRDYSKFVPALDKPWEFEIKPDPRRVEISGLEKLYRRSGQSNPNKWLRNERKGKFYRDISHPRTYDNPIILVEGDSWVHFPYANTDMCQSFYGHFNFFSIGAAGDTLENMLGSYPGKYKNEFQYYLNKLKDDDLSVDALVFSGGGNDIIGERGGKPVLCDLLINYDPSKTAIEHIRNDVYSKTLSEIRNYFIKLIEGARAQDGYNNLPIFIHGYAYPFPWPYGRNDHRKQQCYQDRGADQWLGAAFKQRDIIDHRFQREILIHLIDGLYDILGQIAEAYNHVFLMDLRCLDLPLASWKDEIHPTEDAFGMIGRAFRNAIKQHLHGKAVKPLCQRDEIRRES